MSKNELFAHFRFLNVPIRKNSSKKAFTFIQL